MTFGWTAWPGTGPGLDLLGDVTGRRIVELGSGDGTNAAAIAAAGAVVVGVDRDPARTNAARHSWRHQPRVSFVCADATQWLTDQDDVDIAISVFGALSFSPASPLLSAVAPALRPGGLLAFSTHLPPADDTARANGHSRGWLPYARSPRDWSVLLAQHGLRATTCVEVNRPSDQTHGWPCLIVAARARNHDND